jgi:hypothetical protein
MSLMDKLFVGHLKKKLQHAILNAQDMARKT